MIGAEIHERYQATWALMEEELAVTNWRVLSELNVDGFVAPRPAVFALAHGRPHDSNRVEAPYFVGRAQDARAALMSHVRPDSSVPGQRYEGPERECLARHVLKGERWYRIHFLDPGEELEQVYQAWLQHFGAAGKLDCNGQSAPAAH
ncbi:hypothetical protein IT575_05815 [bacterium]|nr:hypothetical protein [bacterium]